MATIEHNFTVLGVQNTAFYRNEIDLATVQKANLGEQINGKDGLYSAYLQQTINGIIESFEYKNFTNSDLVASIPVKVIKVLYNASTGDFITSEGLYNKPLKSQDYVDFYNLELPAGLKLGHAINIKIANYLCNFVHGNEKDNFTVYCFDPLTLQGVQPVIFTCEQTTYTENGGELTVNVSDSTGACEYSLDGVDYVDSNTFDLVAGNYTIYVKDSENVINSRTFTIVSEII